VNFAQPINDALKPILQLAIDRVGSLVEKAKGLGAQIGRTITIAFAAIKTGQGVKLFTTGLELGIAIAIDKLHLGLKSAVAFLAGALPPIFESLGAKFTDKNFWLGVENIFKSLGNSIAAEIRAALPMADQKEVERLRSLSELQGGIGKLQVEMAGNTDLGAALQEAMDKGLAASKNTIAAHKTDPAIAPLWEAHQAVKDSLKAYADSIEAATAKGTELHPELGKYLARILGTDKGEGDDKPREAAQTMGPLTTAQGRVGGGFGITFSNLAAVGNTTNATLRQTNRYVADIAKNMTRNPMQANIPVLA
jgi:hypothetical protein